MNTPASSITWNWSGAEVEAESFRRIEAEVDPHELSLEHWRIARRMIHTTTEFAIMDELHFADAPVATGLQALKEGRPIYCDSNMIRSGVSIPKLQSFNRNYTRDSLHCFVADADVAQAAKENNTTRALAAVAKGKKIIDDGIVLIGNAPLALARICQLIEAGELRPRLVIGMPVGFVNVIESKQWLMRLKVPQVVLTGRRGGSPLAVTTLHAIMESREED
ncbi:MULTISPECIES: precorrin-8X methylmutase [unclassified Lentimonas]|uniref:precorrin-8X methylmutase n=1 Tax=unclassified Lentimonas TaxID=2630993 RepID=UPI00132A93D6|nr:MULTISPECIES: precorrin-8X methylmutase [unclassified Lentimonas]CAA6691575.1 Cobalt-precorrin-8x methylmutase (EC [Lentimonas sp. CC10]CAA6696243.1 Cobalt-precorrin-8x methylmutase (EC [Lentimonas sp. CC19]CAA7070865.1 Cobalt-precorrin-8x methylmutase (EC [Lentimonas sp. CC11]